jgi:hypothetical protein
VKKPKRTFIIPMSGPDGKVSPEFLAWADGMLRQPEKPKRKRSK